MLSSAVRSLIHVEQLELIAAKTRCGYCGHELTEQPGGTFACARCAPALAAIRTLDEWSAFIRGHAA
jgi:hypothetical protein